MKVSMTEENVVSDIVCKRPLRSSLQALQPCGNTDCRYEYQTSRWATREMLRGKYHGKTLKILYTVLAEKTQLMM